jgi:type IV secretion system protein VirB9
MKIFALIPVLTAFCWAAGSLAAVDPQPGGGDPRLQVVHYVPDEVVEVHAAVGFVTTIEFAEGERMQNIAIGASVGWQVTPNKRGDWLFVKPSLKHRRTNMTVITNLRRYDFELSAPEKTSRGEPADPVFDIRFIYPAPEVRETVMLKVAPPETREPAPPQPSNTRYTYQGSRELIPARVFDDGQFTYFQFSKDQDLPAIYVVGADRKESVMNFSVQRGFVVIDKVAPAFVLRRGPLETRIFNDAFKGPPVTLDSPKLKTKGLF